MKLHGNAKIISNMNFHLSSLIIIRNHTLLCIMHLIIMHYHAIFVMKINMRDRGELPCPHRKATGPRLDVRLFIE
jgi:hypothetical protein